MRAYDFDIFLKTDHEDPSAFLDGFEEVLFDWFGGDVSPAIRSGRALVTCTSSGTSIEEAVRIVLQRLEQGGLQADHLEFPPDAFREAA